MSDKFEPLTKVENLKYQLETLISYPREDLDHPEFEVCYENEHGREGFSTICMVDLGKRALARIIYLERLLGLI